MNLKYLFQLPLIWILGDTSHFYSLCLLHFLMGTNDGPHPKKCAITSIIQLHQKRSPISFSFILCGTHTIYFTNFPLFTISPKSIPMSNNFFFFSFSFLLLSLLFLQIHTHIQVNSLSITIFIIKKLAFFSFYPSLARFSLDSYHVHVNNIYLSLKNQHFSFIHYFGLAIFKGAIIELAFLFLCMIFGHLPTHLREFFYPQRDFWISLLQKYNFKKIINII